MNLHGPDANIEFPKNPRNHDERVGDSAIPIGFVPV
jgi:hypothetical protein